MPNDEKSFILSETRRRHYGTLKPITTNNHNVPRAVHVVLEGESIASIAVKYGTTPAEIKQINKLYSTNLFTSQKLYIPAAKDKDVVYSDSGQTATSQISSSTSSGSLCLDKVNRKPNDYLQELSSRIESLKESVGQQIKHSSFVQSATSRSSTSTDDLSVMTVNPSQSQINVNPPSLVESSGHLHECNL
ncbi:hypothetical protein Ciccas_009647 [Cichlidogyrus casuarinus]|uniref:LysM domain-containing protein n=1 Tax=Cichlidogyrus casuarinus TaxID=1844966 RepID=A0ABD2PWW5_9PLAT